MSLFALRLAMGNNSDDRRAKARSGVRRALRGLDLDISADFSQVYKMLDDLERKHLPYAISTSINSVAKDAKQAIDQQMTQVLDRPTKFTRNAIGIKYSNKRTLQAEVFVKPIQLEYLRWQIFGGTRRSPSQRGVGVPTKNKKLNAYGNIPGRRKGLVKMKQFIATINGATGVWERYGGRRAPQVRLLVAFEPQVEYSKRLPFFKTAQVTVNKMLPKRFNQAMAHALATAKK